ncbi:MAG TPA: hypothetical protein PLD57_13290, partial [Aggregatilineales bacterium]|nr:hypothetical protein [Aggregatilineales bacterium]
AEIPSLHPAARRTGRMIPHLPHPVKALALEFRQLAAYMQAININGLQLPRIPIGGTIQRN